MLYCKFGPGGAQRPPSGRPVSHD